MFRQYAIRLKPYARSVALACLLLAVDVAVQSVFPLLMGRMVSDGIWAGKRIVIRDIGGLMLVLTLLSCGVGLWLCYLSISVAQKTTNQLRKDIHHHAMALSLEQLEKMTNGELLTRAIGDSQVTMQFFSQLLMMFLKPLLLIAVGALLLIGIHPRFSILLLTLVPVQAVLLFFFTRWMSPVFRRMQTHVEGMNTAMQEALDAMRTVKAYGGEATEASRFDKPSHSLWQDSMQIQRAIAVLNPSMLLLMNLGTLLLLWLCSQLSLIGQLDAGQTMAALSYVQQVLMAILLMGQFFPTVSRVKVSGQRLEAFFAVHPDVPDGRTEADGASLVFSLQDVGYAYPGQSDFCLSGLNLTIPQGAFWAVVGPVGCGKSTFAALLPRFYDPTAGRILLNGIPLSAYSLSSLRQKVILVVQESDFSSDTIADNIRYGLSATLEEVAAAARVAQLDSYISTLPMGYITPMNENGLSFSGGQRQCLAIARALLRKPNMLILDASTTSVDLLTEAKLYSSLRKVYPGMGLLVIGQRIATLAGADQIVMMEQGRVVGLGRHKELLQTCGQYGAMCRSQCLEAEL